MSQRGWRALVAFAAGLVVSACSGSSPLSPGQGAQPEATAARPTSPGAVFPLLSGTFTVTTKEGTFNAIYTGEVRDSVGAFSLVVAGGTGVFAGMSGDLLGSGDGAFIGEGRFSLVLSGVVSTPTESRKIRINIRGTATLSCIDEVPILTMTGHGNATRFGPATVVATHRVGNAACG